MTDGQIISAVLAGDTGRFELLVDRYLGMVRALCAAHVGTTVHEDLTQETFIDGYVKLGQLRQPERFAPWLARIARNKCRNWLTKEKTKRRVYNAAAAQIHPAQPEAISKLNQAEMIAFVRQAIDSLPTKTREAMMLCYIEGASIKEASLFLKTSESAVKKRLEYGRHLVSDELWKVVSEHQVKPERGRSVLKKSIITALPLTAIPAKASLAAMVSAKAVLAIATIVLFAGTGVLYVAHEFESQSDTTIQQVAEGDTANPRETSSGPVNDSDNTVSLSEPGLETKEKTGTLLVSSRYHSSSIQWYQATDSDGRIAPNAKVLVIPIEFDEKTLSVWCKEAGISNHDTALLEDIMKIRNGELPDNIAELHPVMDKLIEYLESTYGNPEMIMELYKPAPKEEWGEVRTDAKGKLETELKSGMYNLLARSEADESAWPEQFYGHGEVYVKPNESIKKTLWIEDPEISIRGTIRDAETMEPVPNVYVLLSGEILESGFGKPTATSDELGAFSFQNNMIANSGNFTLEIDTRGSTEYIPHSPVQGHFNLTTQMAPIEILMDKRATVSGHVWQANGEPAPYVTIMRSRVDGSGASSIGTTDAEGYYSCVHDGGEFKFYATTTSIQTDEVSLILDPEESIVQDFVLPAATRVVLDIRTPEGEVPEQFVATFFQAGNHMYSGGVLKKEEELFLIPYLQPGQYHLAFLTKGYAKEEMDLEIRPGELEKRFQITLRKCEESFTVRIVNETGVPIPEIFVNLIVMFRSYNDQGKATGRSMCQFLQLKTDQNGECTFESLAPDEYQVYVETVTQKITLPTDEIVIIEVKPPKFDALHIGNPSINAYDATRENLPLLSEQAILYTIDAEDRLNRDELTIGDNLIVFVKQGYTAAIENVTVTQELWDQREESGSNGFGDVDVYLDEGGILYGTVEEVSQPSQSDQHILVYPTELWPLAQQKENTHQWISFGQALAQGARFDENGNFTLRYLPEGEYMVTIDRNLDHAEGPFEVRSGYETGPVVLRSIKD